MIEVHKTPFRVGLHSWRWGIVLNVGGHVQVIGRRCSLAVERIVTGYSVTPRTVTVEEWNQLKAQWAQRIHSSL